MKSLNIKFLLFFCFYIGGPFILKSQQNFVLNLSDIPLSTPRQLSDWIITKRSLLGIRGFDPVNQRLNLDYHVYVNVWDHDPERWYPLAAEKQNFGATLTRYGTTIVEDEKDWNLMIQRLPDFSNMYGLALRYEGKDLTQWWACDGEQGSDGTTPTCMFAEVTPEHRFFYHNEWFQPTNEDHFQSPKAMDKGDTIGVYGCFVRDVNHGNNPEIHPVQQIWFKDKSQSTNQKTSYWLLFLQDQSERFWQADSYYYNDPNMGNHPPADSLKKYRPWALSPVYGNFRIAFKVNSTPVQANSTPLTINLRVASKREVVTRNHPRINLDADNGFSHSLVIGNRKIVTVNEPSANDNDLGIRFIDVVKLPDGSIQGYVEISSAIGNPNRSGAGYIVLHAEVISPHGPVITH